jgi:hypothetical protein
LTERVRLLFSFNLWLFCCADPEGFDLQQWSLYGTRFYSVLNVLHFGTSALMKFVTGPGFILSWMFFILELTRWWSLSRDQVSICPECSSFCNLHVNEVYYGIGFQSVLNVLHFGTYAPMKFITISGLNPSWLCFILQLTR